MNTGAAGSLLASLDWVSRDVRPILARALDGHEVSVEDGIALTGAEGRDLHALTLVADEMRRRQAGDVVTYVVNRNVNFTNVCIKHCTFCAFSRDHPEEEGYFLPVDEVVRRAQAHQARGRTAASAVAFTNTYVPGAHRPEGLRGVRRLTARSEDPPRGGDDGPRPRVGRPAAPEEEGGYEARSQGRRPEAARS